MEGVASTLSNHPNPKPSCSLSRCTLERLHSLTIGHPKRKPVFQPSFSRCYVCWFQGGEQVFEHDTLERLFCNMIYQHISISPSYYIIILYNIYYIHIHLIYTSIYQCIIIPLYQSIDISMYHYITISRYQYIISICSVAPEKKQSVIKPLFLVAWFRRTLLEKKYIYISTFRRTQTWFQCFGRSTQTHEQ